MKTEESKIKEYLRTQESRTDIELNQAILKAIDLVTDEDIIGWFTHYCYYVPPNWKPLLEVEVLDNPGELSGGEVLPGFILDLSTVWWYPLQRSSQQSDRFNL